MRERSKRAVLKTKVTHPLPFGLKYLQSESSSLIRANRPHLGSNVQLLCSKLLMCSGGTSQKTPSASAKPNVGVPRWVDFNFSMTRRYGIFVGLHCPLWLPQTREVLTKLGVLSLNICGPHLLWSQEESPFFNPWITRSSDKQRLQL